MDFHDLKINTKPIAISDSTDDSRTFKESQTYGLFLNKLVFVAICPSIPHSSYAWAQNTKFQTTFAGFSLKVVSKEGFQGTYN